MSRNAVALREANANILGKEVKSSLLPSKSLSGRFGYTPGVKLLWNRIVLTFLFAKEKLGIAEVLKRQGVQITCLLGRKSLHWKKN